MAGAWRALLLMVGVAVMASVARRQSSEAIVNEAVRVFNHGRPGEPLFRLLEVNPLPERNSTSRRTQLSFRVKETVCISGEQRQRLQECAFREGGEERDCNAVFVRLRLFRTRILTVDCPPATRREPEDIRKRRSAGSPGAATPDFDSS
ncbi:15 kDa protein B-like [Glossophaga mutica]